jgi:DnaJ-class molecular chaperone
MKNDHGCEKCDNTGLLNTATNNTVDDEGEKPCDKCNGTGFVSDGQVTP